MAIVHWCTFPKKRTERDHFDAVDILVMPRREIAIVVEESNVLPFAASANEIRTTNRFRLLEGVIEFRNLQTSEQPLQIIQKFFAEIGILQKEE